MASTAARGAMADDPALNPKRIKTEGTDNSRNPFYFDTIEDRSKTQRIRRANPVKHKIDGELLEAIS